MKIVFNTTAIKPMLDWLIKRKKNEAEESELRSILTLPDYQVEFARYNDDNLPVCKINLEESVDFFLNFDKKDFENPRLQYKKEFFCQFYEHLEDNLPLVEALSNLTISDQELVQKLLENGLPDSLTKTEIEMNVIFIVSIGNSMGWPYKHYIDFDVANLSMFKDQSTFLHVLAHEIHHTKFGYLLKDEYKSEELFLVNFAFEGLAVYYNNNDYTLKTKSKYPYGMIGMDEDTWSLYDREFKELFNHFRTDYYRAKEMDEKSVEELISTYEQFTYTSLIDHKEYKALHYPTYYLGCYLWGSIDLVFGKEKVFELLKDPSNFVLCYNEAARKLGNKDYIL